MICSIAGLAVGIAMFGAMSFLPQYLQIVRGKSPMVSVGLVLMSGLHADTSMVVVGLYMAVTGTGIGLSMQVLVLATQNSVGRADMGVATSGATFFRSMGGAIGVAMFGALLRHQNASTIPERIKEFKVPAEQLRGDTLSIGTPADVARLREALHSAVINGFADSMQTVFFSAAPFALLGFVVVLFLREQRLGTRSVEPVESGSLAKVDDGDAHGAEMDPPQTVGPDGIPAPAPSRA